MTEPPEFSIDPQAFWHDPYPSLAQMRATAPVVHVPELGAVLLTRRDDIFVCEKNIEVFSSWQPQGLMTTLMGTNLMRRDGEVHQRQRKQMFPSVSPRTVLDHWQGEFERYATALLDALDDRQEFDLVPDFAMPLSANALREVTGLLSLSAQEMDDVSQAMIDGCANYAGDAAVEERCHRATAKIDAAIDRAIEEPPPGPRFDIVSVLSQAEQPVDDIRANVKLVISGGQNEPRDAIAGTVWALLTHPDSLDRIRRGEATWAQAFEEYVRWISPIGMSPRRIAQESSWQGIALHAETRAFLMFGSANRDETVFDHPDKFDIERDTSRAVAFGAGPHFCAGAAISRNLIAAIALPMLFERFPNLRVAGDAPFGGWAFRGPLSVPVSTGQTGRDTP